jgi:ATP-dependent DNA ligase
MSTKSWELQKPNGASLNCGCDKVVLGRLLYVQHLEVHGVWLFQAASEHDLEGVVGKWAEGTYQTDGASTSWLKVKNRQYSQMTGRHELFAERRSERAARLKACRRRMLV